MRGKNNGWGRGRAFNLKRTQKTDSSYSSYHLKEASLTKTKRTEGEGEVHERVRQKEHLSFTSRGRVLRGGDAVHLQKKQQEG